MKASGWRQDDVEQRRAPINSRELECLRKDSQPQRPFTLALFILQTCQQMA